MADETTGKSTSDEAPQPNHPPQNASASEPILPRETASAPVVSDGAEETGATRSLPFNVVGIGASAGGIEACIQLFEHVAVDTGMSFVVVLHLSAAHKSHLQEILARHTQMTVVEIESGTPVELNRVHVAPPNALVKLENGIFQLEPLDTTKHAIDHFFISLAAAQKNRAIGVILSGMDSDGALGLRAIKGEGGITMVQAPESARHPEMPRRSISGDHVDVISTPAAIAAQIAQLSRQVRQTNLRRLQEGAPAEDEEQQFVRILALMRGVSGVDFRLYKPSTVRRRIARRMLLHRMDTLRDYLSFLHGNAAELRDLHEDALIGVTRFFRDPEVFDAFKNFVLPRIFEERDPDQQIRMWVAGCSTGEEVYSLAICLLEFLTGSSTQPPIQIFGTDASEINIQKARLANYAETISADVSAERLRRFFVKAERGYQVAKRIRDMCIFARQNLCHDPPFSRMDLISCRNVLIYFGNELQRQLIPTFHYALRPEGFLIVGSAETIREFTDLFSLVDRKNKIYSRSTGISSWAATDVVPGSRGPRVPNPAQTPPDDVHHMELQRAADRILLARFVPTSVVVNDRLEILQTRGRTNPFLELQPGAASLDLLHLTPDSITPQVRTAVRRAIDHDLPVQVQGLRVIDDGLSYEATLDVLPIHVIGQRSKCYLVVFAPPQRQSVDEHSVIDITPGIESKEPILPAEKDRLLAQLRHDLSSTKLYLQSLIEERDAKNQELLSANEEIQSANEELQSTNEELETTKEELQSFNEELHTVNEELQNRNTVLTQASNDMINLLNSVNIPVLMLNNDLAIRHFTPPMQRVMNVRPTDVGRPFGELRLNLNIQDPAPLFEEVLETLTPREIEVQDPEGHWFVLRIRPYRTTDNKIDGLVIALVDIDQLRRIQQELRTARDFGSSVIQGVPLPLVVVDDELRIRAANQAFCNLTPWGAGDLERRSLPALAGSVWGMSDALSERLERLRQSRNAGDSFEFEHTVAGDRWRVFCVRGQVLQPDGEQFSLVTLEDITVHKEAERLFKNETDRLAAQVENTTLALSRSQQELRALAVSLFNSQEEERRRIARELHDDISQRLAALEIDSDKLEKSLMGDANSAKEGLLGIRNQLAHLSEDVRLMSHRLHPSMIEDLGLKAALRNLTDEFGQRENTIVTFSSENVPDEIPFQTATSLYRIAQEALRNVSKHAGQTHTRVSLKGTPEALQLQVADFGHGFDVEAANHGLGLVSMEERARQIGGALQVQSRLGEGTKVTVNVPVAALRQADDISSHAE